MPPACRLSPSPCAAPWLAVLSPFERKGGFTPNGEALIELDGDAEAIGCAEPEPRSM